MDVQTLSLGQFGSPSRGVARLGTRAAVRCGAPQGKTVRLWVVKWREVALATVGGLDATINR